MELINKLFGKKDSIIVRESRKDPGSFLVLNENGGILFEGSKNGCDHYKAKLS